jgi:hypothetical protein
MRRPTRGRGTGASKGANLSKEEVEWLKQYGMRLGQSAPPAIRDKFLALRLIRHKLGGLGLTDEGRAALRSRT